MTIVMRVQGRPGPFFAEVRQTLREVNQDLSIVDLRTLDEVLDDRAEQRRMLAAALAVIGLLGLLLSAIGLYGVVAYGVRERARELGIRLALGARRRCTFRPGGRLASNPCRRCAANDALGAATLSAYLRDHHANDRDDEHDDDHSNPRAGFEDVARKLAARKGRRHEDEQQQLQPSHSFLPATARASRGPSRGPKTEMAY